MMSKPQRKQISKKLRFEIFKRDSFTCCYCGQTPPEAILEIDHIIPVSKGGENDIDNLLTSCFACNRGKGSTELKTVTNKLTDNIEILREKEEQYKEFKKLLKNIKRRQTKEANDIEIIFNEAYPKHGFTDNFKSVSIIPFIKKLNYYEVEEAMQIATNKINDDPEQAIKYFCGVCWSKIRQKHG